MKKIVCMIVAVTIMLTAVTGFAAEEDKIITDVYSFTGTLYLSDWIDGGIILTGVKPLLETEDSVSAASMLEYTEVSAFDGNVINGASGEQLDLVSLAWFLDMEVQVVAARLAGGGLRIMSIITK